MREKAQESLLLDPFRNSKTKKIYDHEQRKKTRFLDCQKRDNRSHSRDLLVYPGFWQLVGDPLACASAW